MRASSPTARGSLQRSPLVPSRFKPSFAVTNEGALGYAFDRNTSPDDLRLIQINSGRLAGSGDPRAWTDGGVTPIQRFAGAFAGNRPNAVEWYFPRRLRLDVNAMSPLRRTPTTRLLGLRPFHTSRIDVPLYAFQTDLTRGRVVRGARRLVRRSRIETYRFTGTTRQSHLDPLMASPRPNRFLRTVVPFLKQSAK